MPYNRTEMELRLTKCHENLNQLFAGIMTDEVGRTFQPHIESVQKYYNTSYQKAEKTSTIEKIISRYEEYIQLLTNVSQGKPKAQERVDIFKQNLLSRKIDVVLSNLAKACELIFWAAAAITLFSSIFMIALPIVIVQPPLGVAIMIAVGGLLIKSAMSCFNCFKEFRTLGRHKKGYDDEVATLIRHREECNKSKKPTLFQPVPEEPVNEESSAEVIDMAPKPAH